MTVHPAGSRLGLEAPEDSPFRRRGGEAVVVVAVRAGATAQSPLVRKTPERTRKRKPLYSAKIEHCGLVKLSNKEAPPKPK